MAVTGGAYGEGDDDMEEPTMTLRVRVERDSLHIGEHCGLRFMRTLRIPDDGRQYPLPPGLGTFPIFRVADYAPRVPATWRERGGVFIPMYQREALWLSFDGAWWKPHALKIAVGKVNAISGGAWHEEVSAGQQDYVVVPDQPWLDGINAGEGWIRQFVAMPLGQGYTVEAQVTGSEDVGGLQLIAFAPKPGRFPDEPPPEQWPDAAVMACAAPAEMGLAAGGRMRQAIYPDEYGWETWDTGATGRVFVHLVNSEVFTEITGLAPPTTPVDARAYTQAGLPWFDLYDEHKGDTGPSEVLANVKSVNNLDAGNGVETHDDASLDVPAEQVTFLGTGEVSDGTW